jgi:hypothetical protein
MRKPHLILIAALVLVAACSREQTPAEKIKAGSEEVVEGMKEGAQDATEATKEAAKDAAEATKEAAEDLQEKATGEH